MNGPKVVISEQLDRTAGEWLEGRATVVRRDYLDSEALARELADADALIVRTYTRVDEALLEASPRLRVVGRAGGSGEHRSG